MLKIGKQGSRGLDLKLPDIEFCTNCSKQILLWTVVANVALLFLKFVGVLVSHSAGLFADLLQSFACVLSSLLLLYSVKMAQKERNDQYPYGFGMIEYIVSTIVFSILIGLGAFIVIENIVLILMGDLATPGILGLPIALTVAFTTFMLYKYNTCAGEKLDSAALTSNGKQVLCDTYSSLGVAAGILLAQVHPMMAISDKLAAIFVGFLILRDSTENWRHNIDIILHKVPAPDFKENINKIVKESYSGEKPHTIKLKRTGKRFWVGIGMEFPENRSVGQMTMATNKIRESLHQKVDWIGEVEFFLDRKRHTAAGSGPRAHP